MSTVVLSLVFRILYRHMSNIYCRQNRLVLIRLNDSKSYITIAIQNACNR